MAVEKPFTGVPGSKSDQYVRELQAEIGCLEEALVLATDAITAAQVKIERLEEGRVKALEALRGLGGIRADCECGWWHSFDCPHWEMVCKPGEDWASECADNCRKARQAIAALEGGAE